MMLFDTLSLLGSSVAVMILSKTRLVLRWGCCSASYNDHTTDITKVHNEDNDDVTKDEIIDSYATLPPPLPPQYRKTKI